MDALKQSNYGLSYRFVFSRLNKRSYLMKLKFFLSQKTSFLSVLLFDKLGLVSDTLIPYVPKWILRKCKDKIFIQPLGTSLS